MERTKVEFSISQSKEIDERGYDKWREVTKVEVEVSEMHAHAVAAEVFKLLSDASLAE